MRTLENASKDLLTSGTSSLPASRRAARWLTISGLALFLALSILYARTKAPWLDEGLQASAAYSAVAHGQFALPQLEESGMTITARIPHIQQYCYIYGPAYLYAAAAWLKAFGYGLLQIRMFSVTWAALAILAWFVVIERLTRDRLAAALGVFLLGVNYQFIVTAANGRFDMMCASLGSVGLAAYLSLREINLTEAILLGSTGAAAAFCSHPMGLLYGLALAWTVIALDSHHVRAKHVMCFMAPWLLCAAAIFAWIWPHRDIAAAQFATHTQARWTALAHPLASILNDAKDRYLAFYFPAGGGTAARMKISILLLGGAICVAGLCVRRIRSSAAFRVLAPSLLIVYCGVALLDNLKFPYYMIHPFLFGTALAAVCAAGLQGGRARVPAMAAVALLALVGIAGVTAKIRENSYAREYCPTIAFIRSHTTPSEYVEGEMSLNFGLGYSDPNFHMDNRMGYYTGVRPSMIVTGEFADLDYFRQREPAVYRFIRHRISAEYREVAQFGNYRIYAPK